ncbi:MAG: hypothetical protein STHCBS139747_000343 [Sporothrix thermara]
MSSSEADKTEKTEVTSKWDNDAHMKLCVALSEALKASESSAAQHKDLIMATLTACNANFTWEGVRQHLQKLRRSTTTDSGAAAAAAAPATPKTPRTPKTPKAKATPRSGTKRKLAKADDDDGKTDAGADVCPAKKLRMEDGSKVKTEDYEDVEGSAGYI